LNVSVAGALVLYHAVRSRREADASNAT